MPQVSKYETVAQSFLDAHPLGQMVTATSLLEWANSHGDGLRADLALDDPGKQINAIKRHLNEGGASPNISEDRRYYVDVEDPKRKTFVVRPYAEYVKDQAISAFGKSVTGALSPLKRSTQAIDSVKLGELSVEERQELEARRENLTTTAAPLRKLYTDEINRQMLTTLERRGIATETARMLIETMPVLGRFQKLLKATA